MRFSIGRLMMLVVLAASNLVAIRSLRALEGIHESLALLLVGAMPMLDVLIVARTFRSPENRFLSGFLAAGWVALVAFLPATVAFAGPLLDAQDAFLRSIFGDGPYGMTKTAALILANFAFYPIPLILVAAIGGLLNRRYRFRILIDRRAGSRTAPAA